MSAPSPPPDLLSLGKISPEAFDRLIAPHLGAERPEVLVGPRPGVDAAIVRLGAGRVMAVTTDPLSLVPGLGPARSAWLAAHLVASDLWTSGIPPAFASVTLTLPPELDEAVIERYLAALGEAWRSLGVAVVTGHTGRHEGCAPPIMGSATLIGVGDEGRAIGPTFVRPGDRVIVTRGAAVETTALAAQLFPRRLGQHLDEGGVARARGWIEHVTVVPACQAALRAGVRDAGVSLLHDATEGGVLGALVEVAMGVAHDLRVERARIPLAPEARAACEMLGIDPFSAVSEGTLVVLARPARAVAVLEELQSAGIPAAEVGEVVGGAGRVWLTEPDGRVETLDAPPADPWWAAYARAVREGWT